MTCGVTRKVRKLAYDLTSPITIRFKSGSKVLQHDYVVLYIGKIKQQVNVLAIRIRLCMWDNVC